jgi:site-specific DNA-methyltransferase (adenine-specific)
MEKVITTNLDIDSWFNNISDNVDLWITDPPYPFDNQNGTNRLKFEDGKDLMYDRLDWPKLRVIFKRMFENTNPGGRVYVFCNDVGLFETKQGLIDAGFTYRKFLIWDKLAMGMGAHWRSQNEYICLATKGRPKSFVRGVSNIFSYKKPRKIDFIPDIGYYPNVLSAKPWQIYRDIIRYSGVHDDVVADPFSGTNPLKASLYHDADNYNKIRLALTNTF